MKMRFPCLLLLALTLLTPRTLAQPDALRGTWSGSWASESGGKAVTVRFFLDGDSLAGEMLSPESLEFSTIAFDGDTRSLVAEAESSELGRFRIEARIEDETRLNGTLTRDDVTGDMKLTKWTFQPR